MRAHLYRPITDPNGNVQPGGTITLLSPGTTDLISDTIYNDDTSGATFPNPFNNDSGVIDVYLPQAQRIDIQVALPAGSLVTFHDVDVLEVGGGFAATSLVLTAIDNSQWQISIGTDGAITTVQIA